MRSRPNKRKDEVAATPLPLSKIGLLGMILLANNSSIWMIFAFLPFMVEFFYPSLSKTELGFRAGLLGSAFSAGGLLGNVISGVLSDKIGRRPALMCGLIGTAITAIGFGFAPNYWIAILFRFLWGLLNGNIGVAKTYLADISDDSNFAQGMALFGVIGGVGRIVGPIIGGFLSSPANTFSVFRGTIFERFPFALPSIIISTYCMIAVTICYFALPETLNTKLRHSKQHRSTKSSNSSSSSNLSSSSSNSAVSSTIYSPLNTSEDGTADGNSEELSIYNPEAKAVEMVSNVVKPDTTEYSRMEAGLSSKSEKIGTPSSGKSKRVSFSSIVKVKEIGTNKLDLNRLKQIQVTDIPIATGKSDPSNDDNCPREYQILERYSNGAEFNASLSSSKKSFFINAKYLMRQRGVVISACLYGVIAFCVSMSTEVIPLWVVTSREDGGFDFRASDIGLITMIGGIFAIILQLTLYPYLVSTIGVLRVHRLGTLLFAVVSFIYPCISLTNAFNWPDFTLVLVIIAQLLQNTFITWSLISVFVLISNSCYSHQRATVNGIGQTCASTGRLLAPYIAGVTFAWSENNGLNWPLNFYLTFYLVTFVLICCFFLSLQLPNTIQRRKREPKVLNYVDDIDFDMEMSSYDDTKHLVKTDSMKKSYIIPISPGNHSNGSSERELVKPEKIEATETPTQTTETPVSAEIEFNTNDNLGAG